MSDSDKVHTQKNYSGASNDTIGGLGPAHVGKMLSGRAARRAHGDTRHRRGTSGSTLLDTLFAASQRPTASAQGASTMNPPITYRSSKKHWRKGVKKYVRKMQEAMANDDSQ